MSESSGTIPSARRFSRTVFIGDVAVGGSHPVVVQSMTNTDTRDIVATRQQITALVQAGCELVRVAVVDREAAAALTALCRDSPVPLIADIHFDYRLALAAVDAGIAGLRINPGNIGSKKKIAAVVRAAQSAAIPIRIGVNSGSVEKKLLEQYGGPVPEALVDSALSHVRLLEEQGFSASKISLKSSSVLDTVQAYRLIASRCDYPLHIGVTEAGTPLRGAVKSSVGMGLLLAQGIGDTMRVSLTGDPVREMLVAWELLRSLGLRERGPEIISCPGCGRTEIPLVRLADEVEEAVCDIQESCSIAVMGCVVNGPGEAREADIGIAGGRKLGIIFRKGKVVRKVTDQAQIMPVFLEELHDLLAEKRKEK